MINCCQNDRAKAGINSATINHRINPKSTYFLVVQSEFISEWLGLSCSSWYRLILVKIVLNSSGIFGIFSYHPILSMIFSNSSGIFGIVLYCLRLFVILTNSSQVFGIVLYCSRFFRNVLKVFVVFSFILRIFCDILEVFMIVLSRTIHCVATNRGSWVC